MAFSSLGSCTPSSIGVGDPVVITFNANVEAGHTIGMFITTDTASVALSSVSDSNGHTWDIEQVSTSDGVAAVAFTKVTNPIVSGVDTVTLDFAGSVDYIIRGFEFSGLSSTEAGANTKGYTESSTYSLAITASDSGVQFVVFSFPVDFGFSDTTITGWTTLSVIDDGTDQSQQVYYKEVTAGSNTASNTIGASVAYFAAGVVLEYETLMPSNSVVWI